MMTEEDARSAVLLAELAVAFARLTTVTLKESIELNHPQVRSPEDLTMMVAGNTAMGLIAACVRHPEWAAAIYAAVTHAPATGPEKLDGVVAWLLQEVPVSITYRDDPMAPPPDA